MGNATVQQTGALMLRGDALRAEYTVDGVVHARVGSVRNEFGAVAWQ